MTALHSADDRAVPLPSADRDAILDGIEDGVTVLAPDASSIYANEAEARLAGYPSLAAFFAAPAEDRRAAVTLFEEQRERITQKVLPGRRVLRGEIP